MAAFMGSGRESGEVLLCTLLGVLSVVTHRAPLRSTRGPLLRDFPSSIAQLQRIRDSNISPSCDSSETLPHKNASSPSSVGRPNARGGRLWSFTRRASGEHHARLYQGSAMANAPQRPRAAGRPRVRMCLRGVHSRPRVSGRLRLDPPAAGALRGDVVRLAPAILGYIVIACTVLGFFSGLSIRLCGQPMANLPGVVKEISTRAASTTRTRRG